MGHLGNIRYNRFAGNILAHRKGKVFRETLKFLAFQQIPQRHHSIFLIGHLNPHCRLAGNGSLNPDVCRCQVQFDVICQIHNPAHLHAGLRLQFVSGNGRSLADIRHGHLYAKGLQGLLQTHGRFPEFYSRITRTFVISLFQKT